MSVARDSFFNVAGSVAPLMLALLTIPFYIDAIGTERYGALAIAWLILGYFGFFDLGLGRATAQRIAALHKSSREQRANVVWTAAFVNIGIGIVGGVILYTAATYFFRNHFRADPLLIEEALEAVPWLAAAVPVVTLTGVASGALQGRKKFIDLNVSTVFGASFFQLFPLAVAFLIGPDLLGLIIAAIIARILGLSILINRTYSHLLRGTRARFDRNEWIVLLNFGGWVTIVSIVGPMLVVIDRFLIGALVSAIAVTIYTVPFDVARRVAVLPASIAAALFPRMAEANDARAALLAERSSNAVNIIVTPVVIASIFISQPFLTFWVGPEIAKLGGPIAVILLMGYWANAFGMIPYSRLQAAGRPHVVALVLIAELPLYVAAMYWAITWIGLIGAAIVFSIRTSVDFAIMHRISAGGWKLSPLIGITAVLVGAGALANLSTDPFSLEWWSAGIVIKVIFLSMAMRRMPREFEQLISPYVPSFLGRHLRYI